MNTKIFLTVACLLLAFSLAEAQEFDITKYGAKPNEDIHKALTDAWKEACNSTTPSTIVIPKGNFTLVQSISFDGPCKAPIKMQVNGIVKASADPANYKGENVGWINFNRIINFTMSGGGTFDGQGETAWKHNICHKSNKCSILPSNIRFNFLNNSLIQDITTKDSKLFHVNVLGCNNLTFLRFTVDAPAHSLNTDGIHVGRSNGVNITDSHIKTGDDCVSIGDGSQQITVSKVTCGPGHGIAVGSLGKHQNEQPVVGITVTNCTITGTMMGVRIKTWPASPVGSATDIHFEDIIMNNVSSPILIDQEYCPYNMCSLQNPSRVKLSKISFKNIRGTTATQLAAKLVCSKTLPCEGVEFADIDLAYNGPEGPAVAQCANVQPKFSGKLNPATCGPVAPLPAAKSAAPAAKPA